ncbi:ComEC/Rec2 family competence protein [Mesorhizobium sp. LHD-90]|uniref:ComEC/Rec2 family competence protein n=1 Tax=Mesorhizobium sp. LHD-90 TaxID=3071414 RepID=UPI0027E07176|nr:ComEC/Rec2 family competence protein [Mesorhizobium sp. LHD-90]MDQ6437121.1 ComEC/Rec2 family competence protein [Mesorhizobium sp. LHD-90]
MSEISAGGLDERFLFRKMDSDAGALIVTRPADSAPPVQSRGPPTRWVRFVPQASNPGAMLARAAVSVRVAATLEVERGVLFLLVPVFLALGAFLYFGLPFEPGVLPFALCLSAAAGATVTLPRGRVLQLAALAILLMLCGMLLAKGETWRMGTKMLGGEISTRITGRVVAVDPLSNGRARLTIDLMATERPKLRYAPDRIRATARAVPAGTKAGSTIEGLVRLRPPSGPVRPDSYDFSFESYFDGIGASGYFMSGPELVDQAGQSTSDRIGAAIENIRADIAVRVTRRIGGAEGEIAAALMVGVRAGIPAEVSEALRRTGLYHIISISGLHMALVAGLVIGALRAGFALFPGLASRRPVRKLAAAAGLAAIAAYLAISGGEVAAQRSFLMLAVMLVAAMVDRAALTMRNLAISAIVVLAIAPHEATGPSFQMSFAATAALVGAYALWTERRAAAAGFAHPRQDLVLWAVKRLGAVTAGLLLTSLVAGLATAAFGAYHFQRIAPLSLVANLAAMPIVSIVVVPSAIMASIAMPFGLDGPFLDAMGWGISAMIGVARWFSDRSPIDAVGLISGRSVVLLTIALIIATVATTRLRLAALPFALAGLVTLGPVRAPDVLVSEDGRLVGYRTGEGLLAVNRQRPNVFTAENWKRTLKAEGLHKPQIAAGADTAPKSLEGDVPAAKNRRDATSLFGGDAPALHMATSGLPPDTMVTNAALEPEDASSGAFSCDEVTCVAWLPSGVAIIHTTDAEEARIACSFAGVIVLDNATVPLRCANPAVAVVTKRDLARHGSAAVYLPANAGDAVNVGFAIGSIERPWHRHRVFSREARGFPAYQRKQSAAPASAANQ